jgi:hypothetical protein
MPFKNPEAKKAYMESYREKKRELRDQERQEMLATFNRTISAQNPLDINSLLQLNTNLTFYKNFGDYKRDHPDAKYENYSEYEEIQKSWLSDRKSERALAVQKALTYLVEFEQNPKIQLWRKLFPKFFKKYE